MKKSQSILWVITPIFLAALLGGTCGGLVQAGSASPDNLRQLLRTYANALQQAEENSAEPFDAEKAINVSIQAMLEKLDPHSQFLDSKSFRKSNEEMQGNYSGLGISFAMVMDKPMITAPPQAGTPAQRLGIRAGDIIVNIQGKPVEGLPIVFVILLV